MGYDPQSVARQLSGYIQKAKRPLRHSIPVLAADPVFADGITLWMDPAGNLRSFAPDGTKYQYAKTTVTAASGSFPADPQPELFEQTYSASWARAFCNTHGAEDGALLGYGDDPSGGHGYRKVMIGLPAATIVTDLTGATVDDVTLTLVNADAYADDITIHVGWHNQTSAPAVYSATRSETVLIEAPKVGRVSTILDDVFGTALRDNLYKGFTIEQPTGFINGGAIDWAATTITIAYTV